MQVRVEAPERKPFREELRILRGIAVVKDDKLVSAALASLEQSDIPDVAYYVGCAARVKRRARAGRERGRAVVPCVASLVFVPVPATWVFTPGSDVRAEFYMNEKDLDSAARELNKLTGPTSRLVRGCKEAAGGTASFRGEIYGH